MALEFLENGSISVENRAAIFAENRPVDPERWEAFKSMTERAKTRDIVVSIDFINETFSRVIDPISCITLRSSIDQFKSFCELNSLICIEMIDTRSFKVRHRNNIK
jgi:hypothetical protein